MKSKWLVLFIVFGLILTACGGGSDDAVEEVVADEPAETLDSPATTAAAAAEPEAPATKVCLVLDIGGLGDQGFNDSAYLGYNMGIDEFGVEGTFLEPDEGGENRGELLNLCAEDGNDLIIGNGFLFDVAMTESATNFPDTNFAITDSVIDPANARGMILAAEQGSFLVGVAAALKTQTNKIGFIGGVDIPLIHAFEVGFVAGVQAVNPDIEIDIKYASVPPDFSGFGDPVKGKEIALAQYEAGADVIYHAAGGTGIGMFEAAAEVSASTGSKVWGIGVDQDQYLTIGGAIPEVQEFILTSMVKKVEVAVYNAIADTVNGTFTGGPVAEDVESGGIDISYTGGYIDDIKDEIEAYRAKIISGEITVPSSR